MPELPEVEVTRLSFADRISGATVTAVRMGKPLRWALGCQPQDLVGRQVQAVRRRGKYLLLDLDHGVLLLHLGMSGSLRFEEQQALPGPHDHFDLLTTRGLLRLHDPRRFGAVVYAAGMDAPEAIKLLGRLGMEPLGADFDSAVFHAGLQRRSAPIKQVLLAGDVVVGVGNIYASEVLFLAGIRPTTQARLLVWRAPTSCTPLCATCWRAPCKVGAAPCAISPTPMVSTACFSSRPWSTGARASLAASVRRRFARCVRASAPPSFVCEARNQECDP